MYSFQSVNTDARSEQALKLGSNMTIINPDECFRAVYMFRRRYSARQKFNIMSMVMDSLTGRMGDRPILPVKLPITISTMLNFDGNCYGDRDGVWMCKQTLSDLCLRQTRLSCWTSAPSVIFAHRIWNGFSIDRSRISSEEIHPSLNKGCPQCYSQRSLQKFHKNENKILFADNFEPYRVWWCGKSLRYTWCIKTSGMGFMQVVHS